MKSLYILTLVTLAACSSNKIDTDKPPMDSIHQQQFNQLKSDVEDLQKAVDELKQNDSIRSRN